MLSIIIPAINEEKRIGKTLEEYCIFFRKKKKDKEIKDFGIVVVLNGCRDRTIDVVKEYKKKYREIKHLDFVQAGKGFAVKKGFKYALKGKSELIGFVDADMSTKPEYFYELLKKINGCDIAIASRYAKGAVLMPRQIFIRRLASKVFNILVRSLFLMPYRDTQCGAKLLKRKAAEIITEQMGMTEWAFDVDMLYIARKNNLKAKELPTVWQDQRESKLNIKKTSIQMFFSIIRLRLVYSPFKFVVRLYDRMPQFFKLHHKL